MLKELRVSRDLTLTELSSKAGLTSGALSRIERGELQPSAETLKRICDALSLSATEADELFVSFELWPEDMSGRRAEVVSVWRKYQGETR